jgi:hypothetical protein
MQRPVRRTGNAPARRPGAGRPPGGENGRPNGQRGPQRMPGRGQPGRPQQQQPVRRALRPHDDRTAVFVAGSPTLHKFIASRLAERTDIWIAQPQSARTYAQGTVFRMKPGVTIVGVDPIWNPAAACQGRYRGLSGGTRHRGGPARLSAECNDRSSGRRTWVVYRAPPQGR